MSAELIKRLRDALEKVAAHHYPPEWKDHPSVIRCADLIAEADAYVAAAQEGK